MNQNLYLINKKNICDILDNENKIVDIIKEAYILFQQGECTLPQSVFLRFPNKKNRIIGLPAYIGGIIDCAGIKWISSYPENIKNGIERASAVIMLNDMMTGNVNTILEGSNISAARTAASAVGAAITLHKREIKKIGIIGCGRINAEVVKIMKKNSGIEFAFLYDKDISRAKKFQKSVLKESEILYSYEEIFQNSEVISIATTATEPYINHIDSLTKNHTVLHISLRDLGTDIIKGSTNIVDSITHVNRENTSINLTYLKEKNLDFVETEIGNIYISGKYERGNKPVIFSPFGLGVLDIMLAQYIRDIAIKNKKYICIEDFS